MLQPLQAFKRFGAKPILANFMMLLKSGCHMGALPQKLVDEPGTVVMEKTNNIS